MVENVRIELTRQRSCKDHPLTQSVPPIMVPAVCYDQTSPALQADVSTTITTQANWSVRPAAIRRPHVGSVRLCH